MALQHLRASTADKRPTPGAMADGQLAINTNLASPGLFFKDSNGDLVKIGPVHIGTTAPNATPASGGQAGNSKGEQWLDTSGANPVLKIWDGSTWQSEAGEFVNASGDTMTGALVMDNQQQVRFREASGNGTNFIALQAPTSVSSDKTITLPDVTGTVVTTGDTGSVTSTMILDGTIVNADINASAGIVDTKLATIATAGKVSNSATTATSTNTNSAIVARDASGNFSAGTITAALTGAASANVLKAGDTMTGALAVTAGTAALPAITPSGDPNTGIYSPGADQLAISTNGTGRLFVNSDGYVGIGTSTPFAGVAVSVSRTGGGEYFPQGDVVARLATASDTEIYNFGNTSLNASSITLSFVPRRSGSVGGQNGWYQKIDSTSTAAGSFVLGTLQRAASGSPAPETPRFFISSAGNVGIGVTSPATTLDVNGDVTITDKIIHGGDTNTAIRFPAADTVSVETNGSERARIDSSGRLLVGTSTSVNTSTPAAASAQIFGAGGSLAIRRGSADNGAPFLVLGKSRSTTDGSYTIVANNDGIGSVRFAADDGTDFLTVGASIEAFVDGTPGADDMPGRLVFSTTADGASSPTARMQIKSNGAILLGSGGINQYSNAKTTSFTFGASATSSNTGTVAFESYGTGTGTIFHFSFSNPNGVVGSISTNASATSYTTSSDYRLKENVVPLTGATDRLNQLQVHRFNFIADPSTTVDGFIAHEAQEVVPECVTGTKDEVDEDGNPVYQGIDQSKLVPLLTAALQEAIGRIEILEAEVAALKAS